MTRSPRARSRSRNAATLLLLWAVTVALTSCGFDYRTLRIPACNRVELELIGDWSQDLVGTWWSLEPARGVLIDTDGSSFFVFNMDGTGEFHAYNREPNYSAHHGAFTWHVDDDQILTINGSNPATLRLRESGNLLLKALELVDERDSHVLTPCEPIANYPD